MFVHMCSFAKHATAEVYYLCHHVVCSEGCKQQNAQQSNEYVVPVQCPLEHLQWLKKHQVRSQITQ